MPYKAIPHCSLSLSVFHALICGTVLVIMWYTSYTSVYHAYSSSKQRSVFACPHPTARHALFFYHEAAGRKLRSKVARP